MAVRPIPEGYHTVTPYLTVADLSRQLDFLQAAFDAIVTEAVPDAEGKVRHAEVRIGNSMVMLGQGREDWPPMTAGLYLYVEDTDLLYNAAIEAGATSVMEPANQFYGDRNAGVKDPNGNTWWIATHVEDVPPDEMKKRAAENMK